MADIPLLVDLLVKVLDSPFIPMGVVMGVKAGYFFQYLRYSE